MMAGDGESVDDSTEAEKLLPETNRRLGGMQFDEDVVFLTKRQAQVLSMREQGYDQETIATQLTCSRANVSNIERSARKNIRKARETIAFADVLAAPVRLELPAAIDLDEAPERIYAACDDAGIKVRYGAPELIRTLRAALDNSGDREILTEGLIVEVTTDGDVRVLTQAS